jgi:hypothetical protein
MTLGAHDALGDAIESALVITKDGHVDPALGKFRPSPYSRAHTPFPINAASPRRRAAAPFE